MRLLYFSPEAWPTFRPDITALFGKYLPRCGIASDLVAYRESDAELPVWAGGETLLGPAPKGRLRSMPGRIANQFRALFQASRYDALQVRDMPTFGLFGLIAARIARRPFAYWMSFPVPEMEVRFARESGWSLGFLRWAMLSLRGHLGAFLLYRAVLPGADHVFVQSDRMRDEVAKRGIDARKITPVPMCVDLEAFASSAPQTKGDVFTIGYLGTCERARRVDFLFEVLKALRDKRRNIRLLLVGDAWLEADKQWLRETAQTLGVADHVEITGWLPAAEGRRRMAEADVAVSLVPPDPLFDVASPTKLVEYLAMGLAVVANEHPDQTAVVETSQAGLTAPFDVERFAAAIAELQDNPEARHQMAERGPGYVSRNRNYAVMAERLAARYFELGGRGHRPVAIGRSEA